MEEHEEVVPVAAHAERLLVGLHGKPRELVGATKEEGSLWGVGARVGLQNNSTKSLGVSQTLSSVPHQKFSL